MIKPFGFVVIDKPQGITSHDCVNRLRQTFGIKRIGHGGTLDPAVTGVLPIAVGDATRLISYLDGSKTYIGEIQLGVSTSTDDIEGKIISTKKWPLINSILIDKLLDQFRGTIMQTPPMISSVHIKGERAYKRARKGEIFDIPPKKITVNKFVLLNWSKKTGQIDVEIDCSSGTYIRAIARDIGKELGCGAYLKKLRRTKALGFTEHQAIELPCCKGPKPANNHPSLINPLIALKHLPRIRIKTDSDLTNWRSGRELQNCNEFRDESYTSTFTETSKNINSIVVLDNSGAIAGIAEKSEFSTYKPKVVFNALG